MRILGVLLLLVSASACAADSEATKTVFVGVPPLRPVVQQVLGSDYRVEVLLPAGASPETFEPKGRQLAELSRAEALFVVGLPFEEVVARRLDRSGTARQMIRLRSPSEATAHPWLDPFSLLEMARSCGEWLVDQRPAEADRVESTVAALETHWRSVDRQLRSRITASDTRAFLTIHPAYDAFATRYGLRQISIEVEGRVPTGRSLVALLEAAREERLSVLLTQPQHASRQADSIARELKLRIVEIDPLQEDVENCMMELIAAIAPTDRTR